MSIIITRCDVARGRNFLASLQQFLDLYDDSIQWVSRGCYKFKLMSAHRSDESKEKVNNIDVHPFRPWLNNGISY